MSALFWKVARPVAIVAFFVWLINNVDQAIAILTAAVMFCVGIFEKIADALQTGVDKADSATAIHLAGTVLHVVTTALGG